MSKLLRERLGKMIGLKRPGSGKEMHEFVCWLNNTVLDGSSLRGVVHMHMENDEVIGVVYRPKPANRISVKVFDHDTAGEPIIYG